jgi:hypothetical protein
MQWPWTAATGYAASRRGCGSAGALSRGGTGPVSGAFSGEVWQVRELPMKAILSVLGIALIVAWLVLWLAVKVTFGAIHLLVVIGVVLIVFAFLRAA